MLNMRMNLSCRQRGFDNVDEAKRYATEDMGYEIDRVEVLDDPEVEGIAMVLIVPVEGEWFALLVDQGEVVDELEAEDFFRNSPNYTQID